MLSVALCTYNGERYIREQIESILGQTMPVDEIVVCDDGSTDSTLHIIEGFHCNKIHIHRNEHNLGVVANFQQAVDLCHGDIIFLSDQDDVWHPDKTETVVDYFEQHKDIQVVFTDAMLIDEAGDSIEGRRLWECVGMTSKSQSYIAKGLGIELFANANRATGATMALKASFPHLHDFQEYCNDSILHDYALSLLSLGARQLGTIPDCLIDYRLHSHQQVGVGEYFDTPMSDDVFSTSYTSGNNYDTYRIDQLHYPEPVATRISFILYRDRSHHKALGFFRIVGFLHNYRKIYGSAFAYRFVIKDLSLWWQNMWHRFISINHKQA